MVDWSVTRRILNATVTPRAPRAPLLTASSLSVRLQVSCAYFWRRRDHSVTPLWGSAYQTGDAPRGSQLEPVGFQLVGFQAWPWEGGGSLSICPPWQQALHTELG